MLKWTGALAAAGIVGVGLGFAGDLLTRPNSTTTSTATKVNTTTQTNVMTETQMATETQMMTATATVTQPVTSTATSTVTQPPSTITATTTQAAPNEVLLTSSWDAGPYYAHIVDGVWRKSSPIEPNLPGCMMIYAGRNRVMSPD